MYIIQDQVQKIRMKCRNKQSAMEALTTFSGLFGSRQEDIQIEDCKKGIVMNYAEFCMGKPTK